MNANLIETTLDAIDLIESGLCTQEQVLQAIEFVAKLGEVHRQLRERVNNATIKYIQANGDIQDGTRRLYVGPNKTTKCKDLRATVLAVLSAVGGDVDALTDCLSSNAFKPGETKKVLGASGDNFFETTTTNKVEEGEPVARLQETDSRFQ